MRGKRLLAAACVMVLFLTACGQGPETPAEIPASNTVVRNETEATAELAETTALVPETAEPATEPHTEAGTESLDVSSSEAPTPAEASAPNQAETEAARPRESQPTEPKPTTPTPTEPKPTEPQKPSEPAHVHSYKATVVAPSCTAKGYTEYKCSCGDSYKDGYTDALGHSFTEQSVAATCTGSGYTLRTCSRCGATETTNTTPPLGHDYRDTVVAPTTSSEGYTEHKCSRCGNSYRDNYTEKLHEVFDLQAVIDYGCAYAQSLGFTVDKSMTLANSSYYPGYYGGGYSLDFLKERAVGNVQYTYDSLIALGDTIPGFRCNIHASYEPDTDKYYIVFLYG